MDIPNESKFSIGSKVRYASSAAWDRRTVRGFGYDKYGWPIIFVERSDGMISTVFEDDLIDVENEAPYEFRNKYTVTLRHGTNKKVSYIITDIFADSKEEAAKIAKETLIEAIGKIDPAQDDFKVKTVTVRTATSVKRY